MLVLVLGGVAAIAYATLSYRSTPYDDDFDRIGAQFGVPSNLLRAIARKESSMRADAISPANANGSRDYGLMQVNSSNLSRLGISIAAALTPAVSIRVAATILAEMRRTLGDRFSSFTWPAAYNVGPDLQPTAVGQAYAGSVMYHWLLYDLGRALGTTRA
jgi:soluble lytic murein transglycosylase-like protein